MRTRELMPIGKAFEYATGQSPNPATIWRWYTHGVRGVKLRIERVGGRTLTSVEMVNEFVDACTEAKQSRTVAPEKPAKDRSKAIAKAKEKLAKVTNRKAD